MESTINQEFKKKKKFHDNCKFQHRCFRSHNFRDEQPDRILHKFALFDIAVQNQNNLIHLLLKNTRTYVPNNANGTDSDSSGTVGSASSLDTDEEEGGNERSQEDDKSTVGSASSLDTDEDENEISLNYDKSTVGSASSLDTDEDEGNNEISQEYDKSTVGSTSYLSKGAEHDEINLLVDKWSIRTEAGPLELHMTSNEKLSKRYNEFLRYKTSTIEILGQRYYILYL